MATARAPPEERKGNLAFKNKDFGRAILLHFEAVDAFGYSPNTNSGSERVGRAKRGEDLNSSRLNSNWSEGCVQTLALVHSNGALC